MLSLQQQSIKHSKHIKVSRKLDVIVERMTLRKAMNKWNLTHFLQAKLEIQTVRESAQTGLEVFHEQKSVIQENYIKNFETTSR